MQCRLGRGNIAKNDGCTKMVAVFTIKEMNYLAKGLFHDLVRGLRSHFICDIKFSGGAISLHSLQRKKIFMLPSTSPREALFACPPFPPWNPLSFTVESTLSFPCSRSDLPLSRQGAALAHLDSLPPYDLVIWTDGSVPFPFGKRRLWRTCQLLSLWQWGHSFLSSRPSMLEFFHWCLRHSASSSLVSTAPTSLPLLFSYLALILSLPPCPLLHLFFYLNLSGRNCLLSPPDLSGYNGSLDTRFSRGMTWLMSWPHTGSVARDLCNPL